MSSERTDRRARRTYKILQLISRVTPTGWDDRIVKALGSARRALRKAANSLRRRGYLLVLAVVLSTTGCRTIVALDDWLPEFGGCEPREVHPDPR